ncbi:alpha/beta-hydrolase [Calocera cornea HHB12733]|uniref:Carboxylic ester hydrolase n=1 Tax=Calocera cornea HHB12733 TaxID=1353952 RepID=A0A165CM83_9BASI|nr:alpha/beta-hydrolase [Calocera cornea HHB12733]
MSSKGNSGQNEGNSPSRVTAKYERPERSWRTLLSLRTGVTLVWLALFGLGIYAPCTVYRLLPATGLFAGRHIVDVGYAKYLGKQTTKTTVAYLGIPFAEPPIGSLRFRKPVPIDTTGRLSPDVIDATTYPDFCIQGYAPWSGPDDRGGAGSEDCLKVNVYTPVCARRGDALPVLVYIHVIGMLALDALRFSSDGRINDCPKFIAVHVYYRLTAFGFLAAPTDAIDLNVGLHDQRAALRWVQSHISAFGGNPDQVTIMGQSAGGGSVFSQMLADYATGEQLFHGVIGQSVSRTGTPRPERKEEAFCNLAAKADCARDSLEDSVECLRQASISAIVRAADDMMKETEDAYNRWMPVLDGELITDYPTRLMKEGKFAHVPLMVGHTTDDGGAKEPLRKAIKLRYPEITEAELDTYERLYPESEPNRVGNAAGDANLRCSTHLWGIAHPDVYAYRWNQPTGPLRLPAAVWHSSDNWMMFEGTSTGSNGTTVFHELTAEQRDFFHEMLAYFTSFVRTGSPNSHKLDRSPEWPLYKEERNRQVLQHQFQADLERDASSTEGTSAMWLEDVSQSEQQRCEALFEMVESCKN